MSIVKPWSRYIFEKLDDVPDVFGVYELGDYNGNVIYIGSGRLKERLNHWKNIDAPCKNQAGKFRYEIIKSDIRCRQRERALLTEFKKRHQGRLPRCNEKGG